MRRAGQGLLFGLLLAIAVSLFPWLPRRPSSENGNPSRPPRPSGNNGRPAGERTADLGLDLADDSDRGRVPPAPQASYVYVTPADFVYPVEDLGKFRRVSLGLLLDRVAPNGAIENVAEGVADLCRTNSFVPGTELLMADGTTKPIENVKIGDYVWATDPGAGEAGPRRVIRLGDHHHISPNRVLRGAVIDKSHTVTQVTNQHASTQVAIGYALDTDVPPDAVIVAAAKKSRSDRAALIVFETGDNDATGSPVPARRALLGYHRDSIADLTTDGGWVIFDYTITYNTQGQPARITVTDPTGTTTTQDRVYNGDGHLVSVTITGPDAGTETHHLVWDAVSPVTQVLAHDIDGQTSNYLYGNQREAINRPDDTTDWFAYNHHGSAVSTTATTDVVAGNILGEPEDWTESGSLILRNGDLQLTYGEEGGLWPATDWNVAGCLRLLSNDLEVDWRVSAERVNKALVGVGLEVVLSDGQSGPQLAASGAHYRAEATSDEESRLEKLSLVEGLEPGSGG